LGSGVQLHEAPEDSRAERAGVPSAQSRLKAAPGPEAVRTREVIAMPDQSLGGRWAALGRGWQAILGAELIRDRGGHLHCGAVSVVEPVPHRVLLCSTRACPRGAHHRSSTALVLDPS